LVSLKGELLCGEVHAARRQDAGAEALLKARNELEKAGKEREALLSKINEVHQMAERAASAADEAENLFRQGEERRRRAERQVIALRGEIDLVERRLEETRLQSVEVQGRRDRESAAVSDASAELRVVEESLERQEAGLDRARADLRARQVHLEGLRTTIAGLEEKKGRAALLEVKLRERCRSREAERSRALSQCDAAGQE
jgi:chromosome segregation ATPase